MTQEFSIDPKDTIKIILYAIFTTGAAELALWFLIYRKDEYKNLKKNIENMTIKKNKEKASFVSQTQLKSHEKKISSIDNQLKALNQEMSSSRMKSTFIIGLFLMIMISALGTEFQGIVVAKLPFEPFSLVKGMTHRGLTGEDFTECCYLFIYILASFVFRTNLQKVCGFEPPRGSSQNPFFNPPK